MPRSPKKAMEDANLPDSTGNIATPPATLAKPVKPAPHTRTPGSRPWPEAIPQTKETFLNEYVANGGVMKAAAEACGVSRNTIYNWLKADQDFYDAFQLAQADANDTIRREVARRAIEGWDEEVYQNGRLAGYVHKFDSNLLMFLAKSRMPEFRDRVDITSAGEHLNATTQAIVDATADPTTADLATQLLERIANSGDHSSGTGSTGL